MKVCVFLGPSLPVATALELLPEGVFLPPVQQGDVYAAMQTHAPAMIGIIDGYFQQRPSVWHKEILYAMSQGVHVFGAASMGALRAAELEAFGMTGIGEIFEAFKDGALPPFKGLVDDDEVAVVHGPPETGYLAVSEALVNIRFTLAAALTQQVIDKPTHDELLTLSRDTHFTKRSHAHLLTQASEQGLCRKNLERLANWLPTGRIDQKRDDALLLVQHLASQMHQIHTPLRAMFNFEQTEIWRDAVADMCSIQSESRESRDSDTVQLAIVDELRLDEANYLKIKQVALLHRRVDSDINNTEIVTDISEKTTSKQSQRKIADDFRRANSLIDRESVDDWLVNNDMRVIEFDDMINHESRFRYVFNTPDTPALVEALIARLRLNGHYPALAKRARQKLTVLTDITATTLPAAKLLSWYFEQEKKRDIPANTESYAKSLGLHNETQLIKLLSREYLFLSEKHN